jgi:transposase-like protein
VILTKNYGMHKIGESKPRKKCRGLLSRKKEAVKFFIKAMNSCGKPTKVNIDKSGANSAALNEIRKN